MILYKFDIEINNVLSENAKGSGQKKDFLRLFK